MMKKILNKLQTFEQYVDKNMNISGDIYSRKLNFFEPVNIKLLRDLDSILTEYDGEGLGEYIEDNVEAGDIVQLNKYPDKSYAVGYFNNRGNGTGIYTIRDNRKFIENYDFIFI